MRTSSGVIFIVFRASERATGYSFYPFMEHAFLTGRIVSSIIFIFLGVSSYVFALFLLHFLTLQSILPAGLVSV